MLPFRTSPVVLSRRHAAKLKPLISGNGKILSASDWRFDPHCKPFTKLEHHLTLHLPKAASKKNTMITPSAQVFCQLPFDEKTLGKGSEIHDAKFFKRFKIEETMKDMGYDAMSSDGSGKTMAFQFNQGMIIQLDMSLQARAESKMDYVAEAFLRLCGFDSKPFAIVSMHEVHFDLFGRRCGAVPGHAVILSSTGDLVLVCEDLLPLTPDEMVERQGHLGQIMCDLLQILSVNLKTGPVIRNVFAIRMINHHVTCFRIDPNEETLKKLVKKKTKATPVFCEEEKLTLLCSDPDPMNNPGLSLIDPKQRKQAVELVSDIRSFIVNP